MVDGITSCSHDVWVIRTQIQLEPEQHGALRRLAQRHNLSMSEAVRRMVREGLRRGLREDSAEPSGAALLLELAGIGDSGLTDLGQRHDDYYVEDVLAELES